jgi:hypothetical protein
VRAVGEVRVIPADVYDYLELSAEAAGGVGGWAFRDDQGVPVCIWGHAGDANASEVVDALSGTGISFVTNDDAVAEINAKIGVERHSARVPFALWAEELGVVRGAH